MSAVENVGIDDGGAAPPPAFKVFTKTSAANAAPDIRIFMTCSPRNLCLFLLYSTPRSDMRIQLRVNGRAATVDVDPSTPLLYVLRNDLRLDGPKFGCGL